MSFKIGGQRGRDMGAAHAVEHGSHGGLLATLLSGFALVISGLSYYEGSMKTAALTVYVPPMIHYARDGGDVFNVPITIANDGAQNGTVLSMTLDVENLKPGPQDRKTARFHSVFLGDYPRDDKTPLRSFAPLSVPGHGTITETVRFYNMGDVMPLLVTDKGDFRFTLTLTTAKSSAGFLDEWFASEPKPLTFDLNLPYFAVQRVEFQNGTISFFNKDWKTAASTNTAPAISREPESSAPADPTPPAAPETAPATPPPAPQTRAEEPAPPAAKPAQKIEVIPERPEPPPPVDPKAAKPAQTQKR